MPTQQAAQRRTVFGAMALLATLAAASPALAQTAKPAPDSTGPQTAIPAPRPNGNADTPGGSARDGVIQPPSSAGGSMPVVQPPAHCVMPVIPPPGTKGNAPSVEAK